MVASIAFIGPHDSGKTTLASKVVICLKKKNFRVGVLKSTKEPGLIIDQPGTDTYKYREAGADAVALIAPDQVFALISNGDINPLYWINKLFLGFDIVICEGFKNFPNIDKIEVVRNLEAKGDNHHPDVVALATNEIYIDSRPVFRLDQAEELASFLEKNYIRKKTESSLGKTTVIVDNTVLELNKQSERVVQDIALELAEKLKISLQACRIEFRITQQH